MAKYLLLNDVVVSTNQGALWYRAGRTVDEANTGVTVSVLRAAGAQLELIREAPNVSGVDDDGLGRGIENYYVVKDAADGSGLEALRVSVPADSQLDLQILVTAKLAGAKNAEWKFGPTYSRNGTGAAALQQADANALSSTGSNTNAPPAGWTAVVSLDGNDVVVTVTTEAGTNVNVTASAYRAKAAA